ncbi:MAG: GH92 family glycosyl hydrolase [Ginsengibacter sp.]
MKIAIVICILSIFGYTQICAQAHDLLSYVNPFIGTSASDVYTKWGNEGGCYPGAVAPSGYIQLTPQTRNTGYDYKDNSILYFSCLNHSSGFPGGSSGDLYLVPVSELNQNNPLLTGRPFDHKNEKAQPGYYRVGLNDDNTLVEATTSIYNGIFRITFPAGTAPKIFIGDAGIVSFNSHNSLYGTKNNVVIHFNKAYNDKQQLADGVILEFTAAATGSTVLLIRLSASHTGTANTLKNLKAEGEKSFDEIKISTRSLWKKYLSVVDVEDNNIINKQKFYTALYHSLLIPWIISDVDGNYRGADGLIHKTRGNYEYGQFSPWDTYRSLHPMLSLLYPEKQGDLLLSMIDFYHQSGHLPTESMTGNHAIDIIMDAYLKGFKGMDSMELYQAMKKQIMTGPFIQKDMKAYLTNGYISSAYPESVTRTVEYAYDDWALAQFAKRVVHFKFDYDSLMVLSNAYKNLFYADSMFLVPRDGNEFLKSPGTIGYKEGDKWVYSYAVPFDARSLINFMGGNVSFTTRLNGALCNDQIVFDNETVFHVPYLFNFAHREDLTQKWVRQIIDKRFSVTPGGLPGNDDLGATSSWLVLSALGIYPFCPGTPDYTIGSPLFASATLQLANKKTFRIKSLHAGVGNYYVHSLKINGRLSRELSISHAAIMKGGEMVFDMTSDSSNTWFDKSLRDVFSETKEYPAFEMSDYSLSAKHVFPNESLWLRFSIRNKGATGTKVVQLMIDGKEYNFKNCFVNKDAVIVDSIKIKLYRIGVTNIMVDRKVVAQVHVVKPPYPYPLQPDISLLAVTPIVKIGDELTVSFVVQNTGGDSQTFFIPLRLNNVPVKTDTMDLLPGEIKNITNSIQSEKAGLQEIEVYKSSVKLKVYENYEDAEILHLPLIDSAIKNDTVPDKSGFENNGIIHRSENVALNDTLLLNKNCYVDVPNSYSLDHMDSAITVMAWVYPQVVSNGLTDMISKGDNHVLQLVNGRQITFFAGGWGRGDCTVVLPVDWLHHWHHIAGVCDGHSLKVFIDGVLKGTSELQQSVNLSNTNKWTIGRNEEFPMQRIFTGFINQVKIYAVPLGQQEIGEEMKRKN